MPAGQRGGKGLGAIRGMWTARDLDNEVAYTSNFWSDVVRWATKNGGDFDIVWDPWADSQTVKSDERYNERPVWTPSSG